MRQGSSVKQSFEQRLKRQGISQQTDNNNDNYFAKFKGLPFWIVDKQKHENKFDGWLSNSFTDPKGVKACCCFWHAVGLPKKHGVPKPCFDYEWQLYRAIEEKKFVWIKKSVGLGISSFMLYYIAYKCLVNDDWRGRQVCIITGPRIEITISLVKRLKALFPDYKFDDKETVCELNGVHIEAFPSHLGINSARGLESPALIWLDEADFFPIGQAQDVRDVAERYIPKSDPYIVMCSTANAPEGLFESIEKLPEDQCLYHRMIMTYEVGLNKIYTPEEVAKARESPSFPREMEGRYIGIQGNVFSQKSIESVIKLGEELEADRRGAIPYSSTKTMGIDAGFGSSKFAIVVVQLVRGFVEVLHAEEYDKPDFSEMIDKIIDIRRNFNVDKCFIDDANPEVVRALKYAYSENQDYHKQISHLQSKHLNPTYWMSILPVNFRSDHKEMLARLKHMMDRESIAISPKFSKLIIALRTATATEGALNKQLTSHDDLLDALRLSLKWFVIPTHKEVSA